MAPRDRFQLGEGESQSKEVPIFEKDVALN